MQIIDIITNEGPVTRYQLAVKTGTADRQIRREIERLKKSGIPVINTGKGYMIPDAKDPAGLSALEAYYKKQRAAAISALASLSEIRKILKENGRA